MAFKEELKQRSDDWTATAEVIEETERKVPGV